MLSSRDPGSFYLVGLGILHWIICVQLVDGGGEGVEDCVGGFMGQAWREPIPLSSTIPWPHKTPRETGKCGLCVL